MSAIKKSFAFGQHQVTLETGEIARQADGSVVVSMGDTVVLVTAVGLAGHLAGFQRDLMLTEGEGFFNSAHDGSHVLNGWLSSSSRNTRAQIGRGMNWF